MSEDSHRHPSDPQDDELTVALGSGHTGRRVVPERIDPDDPFYEPESAKTFVVHGFSFADDPSASDEFDHPADLPATGGSADSEESAPEPAPRPASVGRSSAIMALGSLVSRILGLVRQSMFSAAVGAALVANAFNVANTMPNYLLTVLNAGVLNAVLIPQVTAAMKRGDEGKVFVDKLLTAAFAAILAVTVLGMAITPWLIPATSTQHGAALHLSIVFGLICMPQILFYGLYSVLGNVLNARDQFAAFMWAPALANVVQIGSLGWFLWQWGTRRSPDGWTMQMVWVLAGGTTLSIAIQALVLIPPLLKGGFRYRPRWGLRGAGLGQVSKMLGWTITALLVALAGGILVQKVLTAVTPPDSYTGPAIGGYSSYQYAMLIFQLPHGLITVSILTALFPQMSRTWQDGDVAGMRRLVVRSLNSPAVAVIPASVALFVMADPVVRTILSLSDYDAGPVVLALRIMSVGILGYGISVLQQRYCFARGEGRDNFFYQLFLTAIQVGFALAALWLVPRPWALPLVSVGLVVGNWAQSLLFMAIARRQLGGLDLGGVVRLWTRLLIASVLGGGTAWLVVYGMRMFGPGRLVGLATCVGAGVAFGLVFLAASRILHLREVDDLLAPVLRRVHLAR